MTKEAKDQRRMLKEEQERDASWAREDAEAAEKARELKHKFIKYSLGWGAFVACLTLFLHTEHPIIVWLITFAVISLITLFGGEFYGYDIS